MYIVNCKILLYKTVLEVDHFFTFFALQMCRWTANLISNPVDSIFKWIETTNHVDINLYTIYTYFTIQVCCIHESYFSTSYDR